MSNSGGGAGATGLTSLIDIKTEPVAQSDVSGMDAGQIMDILHGLDIDGVLTAAQAHQKLSDQFEQAATRLAGNAHTLAQSWQGTAAQAAMGKFQEMHDQTATLAAQAKQTSQVLSWLGTEVLPKYKALPDPRVESRTASDEQAGAKAGDKLAGAPGSLVGDVVGGVAGMFHIGSNGQAKADAQARQYLTALNEHLIQANNALPSPIGAPGTGPMGGGQGSSPAAGAGSGNSNVPPLTPVTGGGGTGTAGGTHGAGALPVGQLAAASPGHGGTGTGGAGIGPTGGSRGVPSTGSLQGNPVGSLQSFPATGGPTPPPAGGPGPVLAGPGPGGTTTLPGMPVPGGFASGGGDGEPTDGELPADSELPADAALPGEAAAGGAAGDALPGLEGAGAFGANSAVDGAAVDGAAADEAGPSAMSASSMSAGDAGDAGLAAVPFGAAGSGERDKDRRRHAWMDEDDDIWGFPAWLVPAVIEGGG